MKSIILSPEDIKIYLEGLRKSSSTATYERKLSSLKRYYAWAFQRGYIDTNPVEEYLESNMQIKLPKAISAETASRKFKQNLLTSLSHKPRVQSFLNTLLFKRPKWYLSYHNIPATRYIHLGILMIFSAIIGFGIFEQFFAKSEESLAFPTSLTRPKRYLSFQGRLTDELSNPITAATNIVFKLYDASSGGTTLWNSNTCSVTPDPDGIINVLLGTTSGDNFTCATATEITSSVFSENAEVWLGVTVDTDSEATPRIQIATVAYALNAETVQGFPIAATGSATIATILTMNAGGEVRLAEVGPKVISESGTFTIQGQAITIKTPDTSNGVITINPDGTGTLDLTFEGAAPGGSAGGFVNATNANITSGALYYGEVASNATGYDLIQLKTGSTPTEKFAIDNAGEITVAAGAGLDTNAAGTLDFGVTNANAISIGSSGITTTVNGVLSVYGNTIGLNNDADPNNVLGIAAAGGIAASDLYWGNDLVCDVSESNCGWATIAGASPWTYSAPYLYPDNVTDRVAIGTTTTASMISQFYVTNGSTLGKALAIFDQTENQEILVASKSGTTKFVIDTNGRAAIGWSGGVPTLSNPLEVFNEGTTQVAYFTTAGNLNIDGDLTVEGDNIDSSGAPLVLNATANDEVRIGDAGTPTSATGDGDLYVSAEIETDGQLLLPNGDFGSAKGIIFRNAADSAWDGGIYMSNANILYIEGGAGTNPIILRNDSGTDSVIMSPTGDLYIGQTATDDDDYIYFDTSTSEYLQWDDNPGEFVLSDDFNIGGSVRLGTGGNANSILNSAAGTATTEDLYWGDDLVCDASEANCGWATSASAAYWTRVNGVLYPTTTSDVIAATSSATTVATFTSTGASNFALLVEDQANDTTPFVIDADGDVGIGTTNPGQALTIGNGGIEIIRTGAAPFILFDNGGTDVGQLRGIDTTHLAITSPNAASNYLTVDTSSGNVGIGTTAPSAQLTVGTAPASTINGASIAGAFLSPTAVGNSGNLYVYTTDSVAADTGGVLSFGGIYTGTSETRWAAIAGLKENATSGQYGGYLSFYTRANGSAPSEKMRIESGGDVGIGFTNPATRLDIDTGSNTSGLRLRGTAETVEITDLYVGSVGNFIIDNTAGTDTGAYIDLRSEDDQYGLILRESDGTGTATFANFYVVDDTVDYMNIVVNSTSGAATGLVIDDDNQVGIGTVTPGQALEVVGYADIDDLIVDNNFNWGAQANANPSPEGSLYMTVAISGAGNEYAYQTISRTQYTVVSGDELEFDVYCDKDNPICDASVDITFTDATALRAVNPNDQNSIGQHAGDISAYATGRWYHRKFSLSGVVGKTTDYVDLQEESNTDGTFTNYYRRIMITNGSSIKAVYWDGGHPSTNSTHLSSGASSISAGGTYFHGVQIGVASATHTLGTDGLLVNGKVEFNDTVYFDSGVLANSAGATTISFSGTDVTVAGNLTIAAATGVLDFSSSTGVKTIQTGGSTDLALMPGGNVGIGTTAPSYKLQVAGSSGVTTAIYTNGYVEDVSGIVHGNYTPSHSWNIGTGSVGIFSANGAAAENNRTWGDGPFGNRVIVWEAINDAASDADGGWNTSLFTIDNTKSYRFSAWIKKTNSTDGTTYLGAYDDNLVRVGDSTAQSNPYFWCGDLPSLNKWYLLVGYIYGKDDTSTTTTGGIYDGETGKKVTTYSGTANCSTDFKFTASSTQQRHRAYLYNDVTTADRQYFWDPRVEEVNGKEPSILALLDLPRSNSSGVNWGSGASVGIGTTAPGATLDVLNDLWVSTSNASYYLKTDVNVSATDSVNLIGPFGSTFLQFDATTGSPTTVGVTSSTLNLNGDVNISEASGDTVTSNSGDWSFPNATTWNLGANASYIFDLGANNATGLVATSSSTAINHSNDNVLNSRYIFANAADTSASSIGKHVMRILDDQVNGNWGSAEDRKSVLTVQYDTTNSDSVNSGCTECTVLELVHPSDSGSNGYFIIAREGSSKSGTDPTNAPYFSVAQNGAVYSAAGFYPGNGSIQTTRFFGDNGTYLSASNLDINGTLLMSGQLVDQVGAFRVNSDTLSIQNTGGNAPFRFKTSTGGLFIGGTAASDTDPSFALDVRDNKSTTYVASVQNTSTTNTADGLLVRIDVATTANTMYFVGFSHAGTIGGKIQGSGTDNQVLYTTSGTDYAEYFPFADHVGRPQVGDVVSFTSNINRAVGKAQSPLTPIGVVSDTPGFVGGGSICPEVEAEACEKEYQEAHVLVGLLGQIKTKVATVNGEIKKGDPLTTSSIPGVAAKATQAGPIIGFAMEDFSSAQIDRIPVLVQSGWYDPEVYITDIGNVEISMVPGTDNFTLEENTDSGQRNIEKIGVFASAAIGNLKAGFVNAQKIITQSIQATNAQLDTIATKNINVDQKLVSPVVEVQNLKTGQIESLSGDLAVKLNEDSDLSIKNSQGEEVASIDDQGNATFNGEVAADDVTANELRAGKIFADEIVSKNGTFGEILAGTVSADLVQKSDIEKIQERIASIENKPKADPITLEAIENILSEAQTNNSLLADAQNWNTNTATDSAELNNLAVSTLFVTTSATVASLSASESVTVGSDLVIQSTNNFGLANSINTLTSPLEIQSGGTAPIHLMAGLVKIDTNGDVSILGNLYVAGKIESSGLTLKENKDLRFTNQEGQQPPDKILSLQNDQGNEVASVTASGSARFADVSTNKLVIASHDEKDASAVQNGEIQTNAVSGKAVIPAGRSEITIRNENVTNYTLAYVIPTSSTENKVLYVKAKDNGYFKVGFSEAVGIDVSFDWWIIDVTQ